MTGLTTQEIDRILQGIRQGREEVVRPNKSPISESLPARRAGRDSGFEVLGPAPDVTGSISDTDTTGAQDQNLDTSITGRTTLNSALANNLSIPTLALKGIGTAIGAVTGIPGLGRALHGAVQAHNLSALNTALNTPNAIALRGAGDDPVDDADPTVTTMNISQDDEGHTVNTVEDPNDPSPISEGVGGPAGTSGDVGDGPAGPGDPSGVTQHKGGTVRARMRGGEVRTNLQDGEEVIRAEHSWFYRPVLKAINAGQSPRNVMKVLRSMGGTR